LSNSLSEYADSSGLLHHNVLKPGPSSSSF